MTNDEQVENFFIDCPTCGRRLDKRDPGAMLSHGMFNEETGRYECWDGEGMIPCKSSRLKGEPIEWISIYQFYLN